MALRLIVVALLALGLAGCGEGDAEKLSDRAREQVREGVDEVRERTRDEVAQVQRRAEDLSRRVRRRVERVLEDLEKAVPEAGPLTQPPTVGDRADAQRIDVFLTGVIESVDRYWTRTLRASDLPAPRVNYRWIPPRGRDLSRCGAVADDRAAFYCPADDTIYIGTVLAAELYEGVAEGFPGQAAGQGRAAGDFGVAYIVAHEYAHNLQAELGFFKSTRSRVAKPFELQADCMAGLWGNSVYREGRLKPGDVEEAMNTALAVGDFDYGNEQHHGTPQERRDAWLAGFRSGRPADCTRFTRV